MRKASWIYLGLCLALLLLLVGCGETKEGQVDADGKPAKLVVRVGTNAAYPPFEKLEGSGEITGFDVEIMKAIAKESGFKVEMQHISWEGIFNGIDRGKMDAGISAITIRDDRKQKYDFSDPYFEAQQLILVPKNSPIKSLQDCKGKRIGVQSGTTGEFVVQNAFGKTYSQLQGYEDTPTAIEDLKFGRVDAVVADNGVVMEYVKRIGTNQFKVIEDQSFEPEYYGIILEKGNKELLDQINKGLKRIKENGTYQEIYDKYFGQSKS